MDASGSIDADEFRLQREGYAEALSHPSVLAAIASRRRGAVAIAMVEWGSPGGTVTVMDFMRVSDAVSARALAQAVTLVESTRPDHRAQAETLIQDILPHTGGATRIGISGPPGAGKSTFIERFGLDGIARGHRIAVLAVDPGSKRGGGPMSVQRVKLA